MLEGMSEAIISPGDHVVTVDAFGRERSKVAVTGAVRGGDFVVVWVATPEEWEAAQAEGREVSALPWPVEDVRALTDA